MYHINVLPRLQCNAGLGLFSFRPFKCQGEFSFLQLQGGFIDLDSWDFHTWVNYFLKNNDNPLPIHEPYTLTRRERESITESIQQFQIGENSEGKFLLQKAKVRLSGIEDKSYLTAISLFIKEEQRHARILKEFMDRQDIPIIKRHWVDRVFRRLRRLVNLEMSITVLLTAEIIAAVYYQALKSSTQSRHLIRLCTQILSDEDKHIEFQSDTLHLLLFDHSPLSYWIHRSGHRTLLESTMCIVWFYHKSVLKAGGYTFHTFAKKSRQVFQRSDSIVKQGLTASPSKV